MPTRAWLSGNYQRVWRWSSVEYFQILKLFIGLRLIKTATAELLDKVSRERRSIMLFAFDEHSITPALSSRRLFWWRVFTLFASSAANAYSLVTKLKWKFYNFRSLIKHDFLKSALPVDIVLGKNSIGKIMRIIWEIWSFEISKHQT